SMRLRCSIEPSTARDKARLSCSRRGVRVRQRQVDRQRGAFVRRALHIDCAAEIRNDCIDECEPEARPAANLLGGEERLENARDRRLVHPASAVLDAHTYVTAWSQRSMR